MGEHRVAHKSEMSPGTATRVDVEGVEVLLCNVNGEIFAIEDVCTHDGAPLDQGTLEEKCIVCPRHGAMFDVTTGEALTLPAVMPVMTFRVRIDGDDIYVEC
ncbi:MAG TPA: non-heme iron oxygenase ferredoxin subunit [Candidatus Baltobacteraceae bacterium]|nr:non-heme iron oxygenase ferredoxin subunit [Candidatus Baltobacteraceae bacterium]